MEYIGLVDSVLRAHGADTTPRPWMGLTACNVLRDPSNDWADFDAWLAWSGHRDWEAFEDNGSDLAWGPRSGVDLYEEHYRQADELAAAGEPCHN